MFRSLAALFLIVSAMAAPVLAADAPHDIAGATTVGSDGVVDLILKTHDLVIVDSRVPGDYVSGHIDGAVNLPDTDMTPTVLAGAVPTKATPILFYCNGIKCGRAANATIAALQWGYSRIFYFADGIAGWKASELPLVGQ